MSFWKKVKQTAIADRLVEEKLYELVHRELESGERRDGLWAKAFQNSQGDEQKANALYIGYRVQSIKDEAEITDLFAEKYAVESKKTQAKLNETQGRLEPKKTELPKCSTSRVDQLVECLICKKQIPANSTNCPECGDSKPFECKKQIFATAVVNKAPCPDGRGLSIFKKTKAQGILFLLSLLVLCAIWCIY